MYFHVIIGQDEFPVKSVTATVRILANIVSEETGRIAEDMISSSFDKINFICDNLINNVSKFPHLINEFIWFFGNIVNHPSPVMQEKVKSFIDKFNLLQSRFC